MVIKPFRTTENAFIQMKMFLQNRGGFNNSNFGYFLSTPFITGISAGSPFLSGHFVVNPTPSLTGLNGVPVEVVSGNISKYIWLDTQVGALETGSSSTINYRFSFDFN